MILLLYTQINVLHLSPVLKPVLISGRVFKYFFKDHVKFVLKSSDLSFIYHISCGQLYLDLN